MMRIISSFLFVCATLFSLSSHAADNNYVLGRGDVIRVTVYDHPDMTTEAQINEEGTLSFPLIGKVKVAGQTASGVETLITTGLKAGGYIKNPNVNVAITAYRSQKISVLGDVYKPGLYSLDSEITLQEALATGGGVSPTGGERILLIRGSTSTEYRLSDYLTRGEQLRVKAGDVIFVPRAEQVYVYGQVNRPGAYRLENGMTVMQAIATAGGYTLRADEKDLKVTRVNQGKPQLFSISAHDALQAADVIYVGESLF